jgi:hypothetical protein
MVVVSIVITVLMPLLIVLKLILLLSQLNLTLSCCPTSRLPGRVDASSLNLLDLCN